MNKTSSHFVATVITLFALSAPVHAAKPNDAQIAAIVVAANQVDIEAGELAKTKASSKEVKDFAERMIVDHTAVNQQAAALVSKLKVKPEENEKSKTLKADGEKTRAKLSQLSGKAFDKAYVDHEVAYHQAVLQTIDETLVPNASNAELKALIVKVRPAIDAHLQHAKHIRATLQ